MNTSKQLHGLLAGVTSLLLLVAILCWMEPGQAAAAGDNGHDVTLAELQQKGPQIASEFTGHRANHRQLANFAWREFIALCAPAGILPANRGAPDANRSFVDSGDPNFYQKGKRPRQLGTNLLVWETYAHRSELFPHNQLRGQPWRSAPKYIYGATENGKRPVFNTGVLQLYNNLDEASQIDQNLLFFPTNPPNPFQRNGRYDPNKDVQVLFEAKVNRAEYAYGQTLPAPPSKGGLPPVDLPPNSQSSGTSVEIKAAWRMLTPGMDRSRYHTADAVYYTGTDKRPIAKNGTFGLVGLHIIHKTKMYPTFIFATFEQIDALTVAGTTTDTGLYYITNYTALAYKRAPDAPQAYINNGDGSVPAVALPRAGPLRTHGLPPC